MTPERAGPASALRAASRRRDRQGRRREDDRHGGAHAGRGDGAPPGAGGRGRAGIARPAPRGRPSRAGTNPHLLPPGRSHHRARGRPRRVHPRRAALSRPRPPAPREHVLPGAGGGGPRAHRASGAPAPARVGRGPPPRPPALRPRGGRRTRLRPLSAAPGRAAHARSVRTPGSDRRHARAHRPPPRGPGTVAGVRGHHARGAGGARDGRAVSRDRHPPPPAARATDRERRSAGARPGCRRRRARRSGGDRRRPPASRRGALPPRAPPDRRGPDRGAPARPRRGTRAAPVPVRSAGGAGGRRAPGRRPRQRSRPRGMTRLADSLDGHRIVICVGSGGGGKTTTAAALALEAARRGRRTAVLTVDPAQRLKDAPGLGALGAEPKRVPLGRGVHLDAYLLDVKRTFDELVRGLATTPEQARAVLENRLYQNLSGTLAGSAEYMAVERVYRLADEGGYDLLVVDTPPAQHAVDFLDAPRRLLALLDSRAFAILKDPTSILPAAGSRLAQLVLTGVLRGLERFTGLGLVREIGDFVRVIEDLTGALRARVAEVDALLKNDATSLLLVAAPEPRLIGETEELARALAAVELRVHGVVVNRVLPHALYGSGTPVPVPLDDVPGALRTRLARAFADLRLLAARQESTLAPLLRTAAAPLLAEVPLLPSAPGSLADLDLVAAHLLP